jgi:hypothetical protein
VELDTDGEEEGGEGGQPALCESCNEIGHTVNDCPHQAEREDEEDDEDDDKDEGGDGDGDGGTKGMRAWSGEVSPTEGLGPGAGGGGLYFTGACQGLGASTGASWSVCFRRWYRGAGE